MLTPNQIKNVMFTKSAVGGYKMSEVDDFIVVVCSDYQRLYKENSELLLQVETLNEKVAQYNENEDHIKTALVMAQKVADRVIGDAKDERDRIKESTTKEFGGIVGEAKIRAKKMVEDATQKANDIIVEAKELSDSLLDDTNRQVDTQQRVLATLKQEVSSFRERILGMYEEQTALVNDLPKLEQTILDETGKPKEAQSTDEEDEPINEAKVSKPILNNIADFLNKNFKAGEEIAAELEKENVLPFEEDADADATEKDEGHAEADVEAVVVEEEVKVTPDVQEGDSGVLKMSDDYDIFDGED